MSAGVPAGKEGIEMRIMGLGIPEIIILLVIIAAIVGYVMRRGGNAGVSAPAKRFCPQCGNELAGTAAFCNRCGAQLPPVAVAAPTAATAPASFTPLGIGARVAAVVTVICMFLPWLGMPAIRTLGEYGSYFGLDTAGSYTYPMYDVSDIASALDFLSQSDVFTGIHALFMFGWLAALVLLGVALVMSLVGKRSTVMMLPAGAVAALVAIAWFSAVTYMDGEFSSQLAQFIGYHIEFFTVPPAVAVTAIAGIATAVLGIVARKA